MSKDFFGDMGKAISKQWDRSTKEIGQAFESDLGSIVKKTEKEGFLQGAMEALDVFSPGNVTAELLDGFNIIPEDPGLKEMISGGVNLAAGALFPVAGLPLHLAALKDGFDAVAACTTPPNPAAMKQGCNREAQTPMTPKEALKAAKERAKHEAIEHAKDAARDRAREKNAAVAERVRNGGYADGGCVGGIHDSIEELIKRIGDLFGGDKIKKCEDELDRLLKGAGSMCFEDFIFQFMRAVIKLGQAEVKAKAKELKGIQADDKGDRRKLDGQIADLRTQLASAKTPEEQQKISSRLQNLTDVRGRTVEERMESRAELAEELKMALQKLSEMQQALSNILNTQHETAMAAIRNIR